MKYFIVFYFILWTMEKTRSLSNMDLSEDDQINYRIINGNEAIPHQFPYQAALIMTVGEKKQFCGGSVISEEYILTAAHCLDDVQDVEVILGAHNLSRSETVKRFKLKDYFVHEEWSFDALGGDIALLKVPEKIKFGDTIKPIRLPKYSDENKSLYGRRIIVSGWGRTSDYSDDISPVLRYFESYIISQFWCKLAYLGFPGKRHVCISGLAKKNICGGDSGGPLVSVEKNGMLTLQGIASFGFGFGCTFRWPSVFTRVSSYLPWIYNHTGIIIDN